jgi:hypothetical protein
MICVRCRVLQSSAAAAALLMAAAEEANSEDANAAAQVAQLAAMSAALTVSNTMSPRTGTHFQKVLPTVTG